MRCGAAAERRQRITAFERRYDATASVTLRDGHHLRGNPGVVAVGQLEIGERIFAVRIEARRNENDLGTMTVERVLLSL